MWRGRPGALCAPPARCSPGAENPGRRQGGPTGSRDSRGIRGWSPGTPGGSGAAGGVRSVARLAPCPLRPCAPAAGTWGKYWGAWRARAVSHTAPRSAPRPVARALAGGFTHHQPWLRSRLAATILFPSRSAGPCASSPPPPARSAPAVLLPSPPWRPARGPGSPRSPALDNALVKTAELFLTSPPPLLIKAPP